MEVTIFMDYLSQPSRAVLAFCLLANIPHKVVETQIFQGHTRTKEYAEMNPNRLVPTIKHGDLVLYESGAILTYLADKFQKREWYPEDLRTRTRIDWYLQWHHGNVRLGCGTYFYRIFVKPKLSGRPLPSNYQQDLERLQAASLSRLDSILQTQTYLVSTSHPTLADIQCFCELTQLFMMKKDYASYLHLHRWMKCMWTLAPIREVHSKMIEMFTLTPAL